MRDGQRASMNGGPESDGPEDDHRRSRALLTSILAPNANRHANSRIAKPNDNAPDAEGVNNVEEDFGGVGGYDKWLAS